MVAVLGALVVWMVIANRSFEVIVAWAGAVITLVIIGVAARVAVRHGLAVRDRIQTLTNTVAACQRDTREANVRADGLVAALEGSRQRIADLTAAGDPAQQQAVLAVLGQRQHFFIMRAHVLLVELMNKFEDPDVLNGLFKLDHLVTLMLRKAENVGLLAGENAPRRQFRDAQHWWLVLSEAIAETQQYKRVVVVQPNEGSFAGHATADIIHLLAELVENATEYSRNDSEVTVFVEPVRAGVAIEIVDKGLGIESERLELFNKMLAGSVPVEAGTPVVHGRVGLWVVRRLTEQLGPDVRIWLTHNPYGGITAHVVIPTRLLGAREDGHRPTPETPESVAPIAPLTQVTGAGPATPESHPIVSPTIAARLTADPAADDIDLFRQNESLNGNRPRHASSDPERPQWPGDPDVTVAMTRTPAQTQQETTSVGSSGLPRLPRRQPGLTHLPPGLIGPAGEQGPGEIVDEPPSASLAAAFVDARQAADLDGTDA
ncbi:MAG TPA: ATP-binding protein [Pseudonocardiaceae bacterium]|jgi:signal transduction histidine kinase|nr:ATP-binding protein [Pseudonocardiaceae bacterium]